MAQISNAQRLLYCFIVAIFITVIGVSTLRYLNTKADSSVPVKSMRSWQHADAPLGFPLESSGTAPVFDPRFIQLTAFQRAAIPTATRMAYAMGSEHGALTYNAQPFWSANKRRGGHHTGDDINGIGGMNTDLGDPIYAIGSGLVIYRGEPSPGWGKVLILAHRNPQGEILLSMYAHLHQNYSPLGDLIYLGEAIGSVGTANRHYPAHLHLEMRESTGIHIGRGYTSDPGECISAQKMIKAHLKDNPENIYRAPLSILIAERRERQMEYLSIEN